MTGEIIEEVTPKAKSNFIDSVPEELKSMALEWFAEQVAIGEIVMVQNPQGATRCKA